MLRRMACIAVAAGASFHAMAQQPEPLKLEDKLGAMQTSSTTIEDQTDVAVTVYNNNLALVKDTRKVKLLPGESALNFMDVAQQIMPETVSLRSVSEPGSLRILEQNYEYDLMSPEKLMEKYVGKTVRLVNLHSDIGFEEIEAELLSVNQGPIYKVGDEIYLGHPGNVVLPEIPENLIAKPTLVWLIDNDATDQEIEATYLTRGIEWRADYVVTLDKAEKVAAIEAWVTLNNQAGTAFEDAKLKLVAGEVNQVMPEAPVPMVGGMRALAMEAAPMQEESFAEYHLYTLPRRTTIKENQSKQVSMFTADGVGISKRYEYRGNTSFYSQRFARFDPQHVEVFVEFMNEEKNGLGMPLPSGIMRIYQEDSENMLQFSGEDHIEHTPKDERVQLRMGTAFDVVAERTQTDFTRISDRVFEAAFEISVRNHKETAMKVDVVEPMPADWTILSSSHGHEKKDAFTAIFSLDVPADGEIVLEYRVRVQY